MNVRANADYPFEPREHGVDVVVDRILACLRTVLADSGVPPEAILGVGIGVPGVVEHGPEALLYAPDLRLGRGAAGEAAAGRHRPAAVHRERREHAGPGRAVVRRGPGRPARRGLPGRLGRRRVDHRPRRHRTGRHLQRHRVGPHHDHGRRPGLPLRCAGLPGGLRRGRGHPGAVQPAGGPALPDGDEESALAALVDRPKRRPRRPTVLDETALYLGAGIADLINLFGPDQIILGGWAGLLLGRGCCPRSVRRPTSTRSATPSPRPPSPWAGSARMRSPVARPHCPSRRSCTGPRCPPRAGATSRATRADQPFAALGPGAACGLLAALRPGGFVQGRPSGPFD